MNLLVRAVVGWAGVDGCCQVRATSDPKPGSFPIDRTRDEASQPSVEFS